MIHGMIIVEPHGQLACVCEKWWNLKTFEGNNFNLKEIDVKVLELEGMHEKVTLESDDVNRRYT